MYQKQLKLGSKLLYRFLQEAQTLFDYMSRLACAIFLIPLC